MTKNCPKFLYVLVLTLSLAACFPINYTKSPGASGTVIDSKTHAPVIAATVTLTAVTYAAPKAPVTTSTNQSGEFLFPAEQFWGMYIVPMDPLRLTGKVTVQARGYKSTTKEFKTRTTGPAITNFGAISLEPEN